MGAEDGDAVTALMDRVIGATGIRTARKIGCDTPGGQNTNNAKIKLQEMGIAQNAPRTSHVINARGQPNALNVTRGKRVKNVSRQLTAANAARTKHVPNVACPKLRTIQQKNLPASRTS